MTGPYEIPASFNVDCNLDLWELRNRKQLLCCHFLLYIGNILFQCGDYSDGWAVQPVLPASVSIVSAALVALATIFLGWGLGSGHSKLLPRV